MALRWVPPSNVSVAQADGGSVVGGRSKFNFISSGDTTVTASDNEAQDRLAGEWNPSHPDAILFSDEDPSELMNGQHRLVALIIVSQILGEDLVKWRFPVEFNKPKELMPLLDTGRVRSAADKALMAMKEEGVEFDKATYNDVRVAIMVELANSMHMGQVWGPGELNEFVMEHRDLLAECYKLLRRIQGPRYNASVAAAFAKAALPNYFGKDVIFPLAERLVNQTFKSAEDPLRELYNRLLRIKDRKEKLSNKERYGLRRNLFSTWNFQSILVP